MSDVKTAYWENCNWGWWGADTCDKDPFLAAVDDIPGLVDV